MQVRLLLPVKLCISELNAWKKHGTWFNISLHGFEVYVNITVL